MSSAVDISIRWLILGHTLTFLWLLHVAAAVPAAVTPTQDLMSLLEALQDGVSAGCIQGISAAAMGSVAGAGCALSCRLLKLKRQQLIASCRR
jgi:hypothetical protein